LAACLLPKGPVRALVDDALKNAGNDQGVRLRVITGEPRLAQLPCEFVYWRRHQGERDRRHFFSLNPQLSVVSHVALPEAPPTPTDIEADGELLAFRLAGRLYASEAIDAEVTEWCTTTAAGADVINAADAVEGLAARFDGKAKLVDSLLTGIALAGLIPIVKTPRDKS
jgi:hypothetical protein